jgi:hypothetical protein
MFSCKWRKLCLYENKAHLLETVRRSFKLKLDLYVIPPFQLNRADSDSMKFKSRLMLNLDLKSSYKWA